MNQGGGGQGQVVAGGDVGDIVKALQQQYPGAQVNVEGGDAAALGAGGRRIRAGTTAWRSSSGSRS